MLPVHQRYLDGELPQALYYGRGPATQTPIHPKNNAVPIPCQIGNSRYRFGVIRIQDGTLSKRRWVEASRTGLRNRLVSNELVVELVLPLKQRWQT